MVDNILILAGGSGTRLWPASLNEYPKQFIKVRDGKSLLNLTIERALSLKITGRIIIITLKSQLESVIDECGSYSSTGRIAVLPEPAPRNTAPAISAAVWWLKLCGSLKGTSLVLPADHMIEPAEKFRLNAEQADSLAREGYLVTFGIPPAWAETGYGYIEAGKPHGNGFLVSSFREKPDRSTAEKFIKDGNYFWNSGMFVFRNDIFLEEVEKHSEAIISAFSRLEAAPSPSSIGGMDIIMDSPDVAEIYKSSPSISVDYAVMEKTSRAAMVRADYLWNDIGSWDQFDSLIDREQQRNLFEVDSSGNSVFSDIPVAMCDVSDLIVVIKNNRALVCRKGSSQKIRDVRAIIEEKGRTELL